MTIGYDYSRKDNAYFSGSGHITNLADPQCKKDQHVGKKIQKAYDKDFYFMNTPLFFQIRSHFDKHIRCEKKQSNDKHGKEDNNGEQDGPPNKGNFIQAFLILITIVLSKV